LLREVNDVAKKKPAAKKRTPQKPVRKKPAAKAAKPLVDASLELAQAGFFRGEYHWEADRDVPALGERVRLLVEHAAGRVSPEQARAVELLLESKQALRSLALKAAYDCMLQWVDGYRQRHPGFRGKPIAEKPFTRGCELKSVRFPMSSPAVPDPALVFVLSLFWPDDTRPCLVSFGHVKGKWLVTQCERI
jgi:hypothetical protein